VNYVTTGPRWTWYLSPVYFFTVDATASRTTYGVSPFDGTQLFSGLTLGKRLSIDSTVSLVFSAEDSRFDNTLVNSNFVRESVYGRYQVLGGARGGLTVELGAATVRADSRSIADPHVLLAFKRVISPHATLHLEAGQSLIDASDNFRSFVGGGALGGITTAPVVGTTSPYLMRYLVGDWRYERPRTVFLVSTRIERDMYSQAPLFDLKQENLEFRAQRRLSPQISAEVRGGLIWYQYADAGFTGTDHVFGASVIAKLSRRAQASLQYDHAQHAVTGAFTDYDVNEVRLTVGFTSR